MILRAKYLITGDGRTCLQDQAVYLDKEGKIGWIGDAAESGGRYPEEMVKDYGEATILPDCLIACAFRLLLQPAGSG